MGAGLRQSADLHRGPALQRVPPQALLLRNLEEGLRNSGWKRSDRPDPPAVAQEFVESVFRPVSYPETTRHSYRQRVLCPPPVPRTRRPGDVQGALRQKGQPQSLESFS